MLVVVWLIAWSLADELLPASSEGHTPAAYWLTGTATAVLFVAGLLAHELSHSLVAVRRGIPVHDIRLWILGGIASIEREPETPRDDFAIAIAGPLASLVIGGAGLGVAALLAAADTAPLVRGALEWLGSINLLLAAFNLAPAAPLDGGRLLRSFLWRRHGDRTLAAVQAARAGQTFAGVLIALGLLSFFAGATIQGVWFAFLGWFLLNAARAEELQATVRHDFASMTVASLMSTPVVTAPSWASVADVLDEFVLTHRCSSFPLVDDDGVIRALVTLDDVRRVPADRRAVTPALDIAVPLRQIALATPQTSALVLLDRLAASASRRGLVVLDDARPSEPHNLVGIVTPTDVTRAALLARDQSYPGPAAADANRNPVSTGGQP